VEKKKFSLKSQSERMVLGPDVRSKVSQWTYGPEPGHTVQSVTGNFIFTSCLKAHVSLF
jgi:hypothetical protein